MRRSGIVNPRFRCNFLLLNILSRADVVHFARISRRSTSGYEYWHIGYLFEPNSVLPSRVATHSRISVTFNSLRLFQGFKGSRELQKRLRGIEHGRMSGIAWGQYHLTSQRWKLGLWESNKTTYLIYLLCSPRRSPCFRISSSSLNSSRALVMASIIRH